MVFQDIAVFVAYTAVRHGNFTTWLQVAAAFSGLLMLVPTLSLAVMLLRVFWASRRKPVSLSDEPQQMLGKPLLFPVKLNHIRLTPVKNQFANRFLMVGIPVGLRCRVGNLLSVDDKRLTLNNSSARGAPWSCMLSQLSCWLTVDSERYLHRGDQHLDLREKLDVFLKQQNEDPAQWPYAYLLSVPRFLWWSRSVVTWWYLYSPARELDAVVIEINNSYDEKRNTLFRVHRSSEKDIAITAGSTDTSADSSNGIVEEVAAQYLDEHHLIRHLSSQPKATFYKGVWEKYVFASPFEKVDGSVSNRFRDLAYDGISSWEQNATMLNTNTLSPSGKVKMITRMTCEGKPLDPSEMTFAELARVLFLWTVPGIMTTPTIVFEALRIRYRGLQKFMYKTPVRSGSVGRHASWVERSLEPFFRDYLASCVARYPGAVELTYLPCRSFSNEIIRMRSPSCPANNDESVRSLTVEPLDPSFYTRIVNYPSAQKGIETELRETGMEADVVSQHLAVSDPLLLQNLLKASTRYKNTGNTPYSDSPFSAILLRQPILLSCLRWNLSPAFMDEFVANALPLSSRAAYVRLVIHHFLVHRLAFGFHFLFWIYGVIATTSIKLAILRISGEVFESRAFLASDPLVAAESLVGWLVCYIFVSSVIESVGSRLTLAELPQMKRV